MLSPFFVLPWSCVWGVMSADNYFAFFIVVGCFSVSSPVKFQI